MYFYESRESNERFASSRKAGSSLENCIRALTAVIADGTRFIRERGPREKLRERDSGMVSRGVSSTFSNLQQIELLSKNRGVV